MKANSSVQLCFPQQYWHIRGQRNCSPATVTYKGTMQLFPSRPATPIPYAVGNDFCWFFMQWLAVMKDISVTGKSSLLLKTSSFLSFSLWGKLLAWQHLRLTAPSYPLPVLYLDSHTGKIIPKISRRHRAAPHPFFFTQWKSSSVPELYTQK